MLPPLLIGIGFRRSGDQNGFRIWIPFILLWPAILVLALVTFVVSIPVLVVAAPMGYGRPVVLAVPYLYRVMCSLRGLRIDAGGNSGDVFISFW